MAKRGKSGGSFGKGSIGGAGGTKAAIRRGARSASGGRGGTKRLPVPGNVSGAATTGDGRARTMSK